MILFFHLLNDHSGSPRVLCSSLEALNAKDCGQLYVGSQGKGVLERYRVITKYYWYFRSKFKLVTLFTYLISQVLLFIKLYRATDIPKDAIIFVNTLLPFGAMMWGKMTGKTVIVHVHEISITPTPFRWFLKRCASYCADRLLYVSNDHAKRMYIDGPRGYVVFNPVDMEIASRAEIAPKYKPRRSGCFQILMLSSLKGYKGIFEFIALAQKLSLRADIKFILVLNADENEVAEFAQGYKELDNIDFYSRTNDPSRYYEHADLVLNLSRVDEWIETFGLTIVEAMTFGIPVIVPPVGGPSEIVNHGVDGYCIDCKDENLLIENIINLANTPELAMRLSGNAKLKSENYSFHAYSSALQSILYQND